MEILNKTRSYGNVDAMLDKIRIYSSGDSISSRDLITILVKEGSISEMEARKVTQYIEVNNKVNVQKFMDVFNRSL